MVVQVAAVVKGLQVAGQVKDVADTVNFAAKEMNINQNSVFAKNEREGNGGAINSVFQAADTVSFGAVGKVTQAIDATSGGTFSKTVQMADKIATPVMEVADLMGGPDIEDGAKILKKMPDLNA